MKLSVSRLAGTGILVFCAIAFSGLAATVAGEAHRHARAQAGSAIDQIKLDAGKKWSTDAALRSGMAAIRAAFETDHARIDSGNEADAEYDALAERIEAQVNGLFRNCHLPAAADANLHFLIADLLRGAGVMRGRDPAHERHQGAQLVHGALAAYGRTFDDPHWAP